MSFTIDTEDLWQDPTYADVVVQRCGKKWFCHKLVICPQSDFFLSKCSEGDRSNFGKQDIIELDEKFSADAIEFCLEYLYREDVNLNDRPNFTREIIFDINELADVLELSDLVSSTQEVLRGYLRDGALVDRARAIRHLNRAMIEIEVYWDVSVTVEMNMKAFLQDPEAWALLPEDAITRFLDSYERRMRDAHDRSLLCQESVNTFFDTLNRRTKAMREQMADKDVDVGAKRKRM
ncbi:unnamed protein product [Zymoseptoria tritici ST99CH_3D7]|uniref:BTB domain-containing protein n=2 Tax=Zymoseptoria tritici TaxID=1047171 RepID=A0A1X7S5F5_ZYMT9|nr:unnamed protein product [Zymoseptoria tritici ST99CH_3D7]SMR59306.1 unnamed protein product [Zymoseptoria tritici ST99CH_1E4]